MLNGLSLFSGIGGLDVALSEWVRPIAYCELDPYCQGVLLGRMGSQEIANSPIWDDISTFSGAELRGAADIIYGGFPCQDISIAGLGKGLEGERSGLFFEIVRLAKEVKPIFIFLENVPAITSRGGLRVVREITEMGYDCRWCVISAASVGAPHLRERWFMLAHAKHPRSHGSEVGRGAETGISNPPQGSHISEQLAGMDNTRDVARAFAADSPGMRLDQGSRERICAQREAIKYEEDGNLCSEIADPYLSIYWKNTQPPLCGVDDGVPNRVHRIRALGNAVVPSQAKKAFKMLMGA